MNNRYIMIIEKGKLQTVMPKSLFLKNNAALAGWRYFFMETTKSRRIIIKEIMNSLSISTTSSPDR